MKTLAYRILNVFARDGRLTGNPLCVFEDGTGLDDATMQALARQFNLSETTFILPSGSATARVRIFTPAYEMAFAGHPTLGTAHVVRSLRRCGDHVDLEMEAGTIPVEARGDHWVLTAKSPGLRDAVESTHALADAVSLDARDIAGRAIWASAGTEQLMLPVKSKAAVERAIANPGPFLRLESASPPPKVYVFHDEGDESRLVHARFFFPGVGAILEDPATGSACANLGAWYTRTRAGEDIERVVLQGEAIARPSRLHLTVIQGTVRVGGDVVELARGTLGL